MAGRRRTGAGLKAFADTIEPFAKAKVENEYKRSNASFEYELKKQKERDDFDRRMVEAGILEDKIKKGELSPYAASYAAGGKGSYSGRRPTTQDVESDLVNRLRSSDSEVVRQAQEELETRSRVRKELKPGQGSRFEESEEDQLFREEQARKAKRGFFGNTKDFLFGTGEAEAAEVAPGTGLVPQTGLTSATRFGSPATPQLGTAPSRSLGQRPVNPQLVQQVLQEAEDALRRGASPEDVRRRVQEILGY